MLPPAHEWLTQPQSDLAVGARPGWARFDADWYLARYPEAHDYCRGEPSAALPYYLEIGVQLGHSPSPLFDEQFYLAGNPDVHELVRQGHYRSGFDHFCQHGHRLLSPHWLFNDALYASRHDDMSLENLDQHLFSGRYDHYLRSGQFERRAAHYLFDAAYYRLRAIEAGAGADEIDARGAYEHFLYSLFPGTPERRPSIYFEPIWYIENTPNVAAAIAARRRGSALEHYLCNDTPELFDPVPQFSESYYRARHADVARSIETGYFRNGYEHFVGFGAFELRAPRAEIDLAYYCEAHARVRDDLRAGLVRDAFAHLRLIGLPENLPFAPPDALPLITEPVAKQIFLRRARDNLLLLARHKLDFSTDAPALSVIMVLFNRFDLTAFALASLRDNFAGGIELILVDNGSSDDTKRLSHYIKGARIIRLEENIGFLRAANQGLAHATAPALLYLNNDVELGHNAIEAGLKRLASAENIGAVCGKVMRSHGALQEAGSIIWADAATTGYLRDAPATAPAANFVRDVDYGSAVFLLCRTALAHQLAGFDPAYAPAYYEDADFCIRLRQAGYRTVYDPAVTLRHLEFGSAQNAETAMALMRRGQKIFAAKHAAYLQTRPPSAPANLLAARRADNKPRVLYFEDTIPLRRLGSGFVRSNDIVREIAAAGHEVAVFPVNGAFHDLMSLFGDLPEDVEILHDHNINLLEKFLRERPNHYDLIWIARTHNLARLRPILELAAPTIKTLPIVLDTEAVVTIRDAAFALIFGTPDQNFNFDAAVQAEFAGAEICRHITAVSRFEVDLLNAIGLPSVSLLGTQREPEPESPGFATRQDLLMVAALHRQDSPNLDALRWYAHEILPALARELDPLPTLHVAGYIAPEIDLAELENLPGLKLHGPIDDLTPLYQSCRAFIAPTRFAAGTPYKIYEAAAHGLPCVVTELLARQLGWSPGTDLLTAPVYDAKRFAAQIAMLYRTETVWTRLRQAATTRLATENTPASFSRDVREILTGVLGAPRK